MKTKALTITVLVASLLMICCGSLFSQKTIKLKNFSEKLPIIQLEEKTLQKYLLLIDNQNFDIYGDPGSKSGITAEYTREFQNDSVKWNKLNTVNCTKT